MTDQPAQSPAQIATANVKQKSRGFNPVWVIPIIALLLGGWMVFKSALEENTRIEVSFKDASGIVAGKTVVKLRDVEIGKVTAVNFSKDLATINLMLEFKDVPADRFNEKTRFWVVRPRVGIGGVSGLDTLLSGAFIEVDPSNIEGGKPVAKYVGLEQPELHQLGNPGTSYRLKTVALGSLSRQSPVKYRDLEVGQVTGYELSKDNTSVDVEIFIRAPYDQLVKNDTRFWSISGLSVDVGAQGVKVNMDSVATLVAGGIAFSTSASSSGAQAEKNSVFNLYQTEKEDPVSEETLAFYVPMKLYFEAGVSGLSVDAPVEYKGLRLGTVAEISVDLDEVKDEIRTFAIVKIEPDRLPATGMVRSDKSDAERTRLAHEFFETMAARGMRAQLKTGNLLTGKALVVLDMFPQAKQASVKYVDGVAVFPTLPPESLANVLAKVDAILAKIDAMPIEKIGNNLATMSSNLADTTAKIDALPIEKIGRNLADTTAKIDAIPVGQISSDLKELLVSLNGLVESLNAAQGGVIGIQTRDAIAEITRAARALRGMAEYLERHPEALLKGKKSN